MSQNQNNKTDENISEESNELQLISELRYIQVRKFKIRVPNSPNKRLWLGIGLTIVGVFPGPPGPAASLVGISILSIDNPRLRKARRKSTVWIGRRTWARQKLDSEEVEK